MKNEKTYELVLTALFTAIIVIMAFTPLGYIPLVVINATVIHIPVILGALFLGPKKGAFLGFVFGLTSFINNTFKAATASAFVFSPVLAANMIGVSGVFKSTYICFVPRILVGVLPYFVYILIRNLLKSEQKIWRIVTPRGRIRHPVSLREGLYQQPHRGCKFDRRRGRHPLWRYFVFRADNQRIQEEFVQYRPGLCGSDRSFHQYVICHERYLYPV